jgi:hypothetical protein
MSDTPPAPVPPPAGHEIRVSVASATDIAAERAERELDLARIPLPLSSRPCFIRHLGRPDALSIIAHDADGRCLSMLAMTRTPTRALPGHHILRVEAVGDSLATPAGSVILEEAVRQARAQSRALRLVIELECRHDHTRDLLSTTLARLGCHRIPCERIPDRTVIVDLAPEEETIFSALGKSTRQNIRAAAKQGLAIAPVEDPALGPRMNELLALALTRTGGVVHAEDWEAVLRVCAERPNRSRVVGIFKGSSRTPADLLGFAWGLHHGDRVEYHTGASARVPEVKIRLLSPVLWDLIAWGRRTGGTWFDLGGVTHGSRGSDDALGGISDFKRSFSTLEIPVGQEWATEPNPGLWRLASLSSGLARWVRRVRFR